MSLEDSISALLPSYDKWIAEFTTVRAGDDSAKHFLQTVVPLLTRVAIQDGIYFIEAFLITLSRSC